MQKSGLSAAQVSCAQSIRATPMLTALKATHQFQQTDAPRGNLTLGRAVLWGAPARVAIIESRIAAGSLGVMECTALEQLFLACHRSGESLIFFLDCAGARVSEGLPALAAFRRMFGAALALDPARVVAYCGKHCFGGGSMLAALAGQRVLAADTRFAMSGPAIIADAANDDIAHINAQLSGAARRNASLGYGFALTREKPESPLHTRLSGFFSEAERVAARALFPAGGASEVMLTDGAPMSAARAWALADWLWAQGSTLSAVLRIVVDCPSHAATLQDEQQYLSAQLVNLARALYALRAGGCAIDTIIRGSLGGGIYLSLAAASGRVLLAPGAAIRLLPGKAMAAILGENVELHSAHAAYLAAGVAEGQWAPET